MPERYSAIIAAFALRAIHHSAPAGLSSATVEIWGTTPIGTGREDRDPPHCEFFQKIGSVVARSRNARASGIFLTKTSQWVARVTESRCVNADRSAAVSH
jgi:hypothetical protein